MKIDFKQLEFIHSTLRRILSHIEDETGIEFTITSLYRIDDSGVHGQLPVRGCDLRMRNTLIGIEMENLINSYWMYDPQRPNKKCAVLHGKGSNLHLHVQCHNDTESVI